MRPASKTQYARLKANQNATLKDKGHVLAFSQNVGADFRQGVATYTPGAACPMGYRPQSPKEVHDDQEVAVLMGRVRLPLGTAVTSKSRIRITHIEGEELGTALDFAVYGEPMIRPTIIICQLQKITDKSTGS